MTRTTRWCSVAAMLLGSVAFEDARAQPAPMAATDARAQAQSLMDMGNGYLQQGDYVRALESFRAAYGLFPSPKLLLNIGTTSKLLGRNAEAASAYAAYLARPDRDPKRAVEVERLLSELDGSIAIVRIVVRTEGAIVRLDGRVLGPAPLDADVRVEPGEHALSVEKVGMRPGVAALRLGAGERPRVQLEPSQQAVIQRVVRVATGEGQLVLGITVGSIGVGALIAGAIAGGIALAKEGDANGHCDATRPEICDAEGVRLGDAAKAIGTASTVLLVVGGAAVGAGIIILATTPSGDAPRASVKVGARPESGGASLAVEVKF